MSISAAPSGPSPLMNGVSRLINEARAGKGESLGKILEVYQSYLSILASTHMRTNLRGRLNPSDVVQETMLAAYRGFPQFRGQSEGELLAWLRQTLINCLHRAVETHVTAQKRDVRCEVSIDQAIANLEHSATNLAGCLADPGPSPSSAMRERERQFALAGQLEKLKPEYRDVIVMRNLHGLSFEHIGKRMNRKTGTVRMLWLRAIEKFREVCEPIE